MRPFAALFFLAIANLSHAQSAGDLQLVIDPPGDMQYATYIDGTVASTGDIHFLGGYQNVAMSAFTLATFSSVGAPIWSRKVETTAADLNMLARKVMVDANGYITVFGNLGTGLGSGYFLVRMTPEGVLQWQRMYLPGVGSADYGFSSAYGLADGGVMMSLGLLDKAMMVRVDANGEVTWSRSYITTDGPTGKNPGFEPAFTSDGGALITAKAENDMYLVRIDANGEVQWSNRYPTGTYTHTNTAVSLADGGFLVAGVSGTQPFAARLDAYGNLVWNRSYGLDEGWIEHFDDIQALPDGGFLLSPSKSSMGVMGVRITAAGEPVEVVLVDGNGMANVIGSHGDKVLMMGRTTAEVDGEYEDLFMLLKLNADLGMGCLRSTSGAWSTGQTLLGPLVPGCSSVEEPLLDAAFYVVGSDVVFGTRALCASLTDVDEHNLDRALSVYPSPVTSGTALSVEVGDAHDVLYLEWIAPDGRLVSEQRVAVGAQRISMDTKGAAPGPYLIRAIDVHGAPVASARVVVE